MRHAVIWGRRRQGKSTLAMALAASFPQNKPIIIFDPCNQFAAWPSRTLPEIEDRLEYEEYDDGVLRYVPGSDPAEEFGDLMDILDGGHWEWSGYTLIIDEAAMIQRPQTLNPALARLIRQSPDDIVVIETLHRPSETHSTVRALASDQFFFNTFLERDIQVIRGTYGDDVAAKVSSLGAYEVLHFWLDAGGHPRYEIWKENSIWYVPLKREE